LIAEDVAAVKPDLVVRDENGEIYTVRYDAVNAMLLNEFLKEHKKVQEQNSKIQQQEATIAELKSTVAQQQKNFQATAAHQQKQIEAVTADCRKSAHSSPQRVRPVADLMRASLRRRWSTIPKSRVRIPRARDTLTGKSQSTTPSQMYQWEGLGPDVVLTWTKRGTNAA